MLIRYFHVQPRSSHASNLYLLSFSDFSELLHSLIQNPVIIKHETKYEIPSCKGLKKHFDCWKKKGVSNIPSFEFSWPQTPFKYSISSSEFQLVLCVTAGIDCITKSSSPLVVKRVQLRPVNCHPLSVKGKRRGRGSSSSREMKMCVCMHVSELRRCMYVGTQKTSKFTNTRAYIDARAHSPMHFDCWAYRNHTW